MLGFKIGTGKHERKNRTNKESASPIRARSG
jgi:hypothetical protein